MGILDRYVPEDFIKKLRRELHGFSKLSVGQQAKLGIYIFHAGSPRRQHKLDSAWSSFGYKELSADFGRNGFKRINDSLGVFEVSKNWHHSRGATKRYRLTAPVLAIRTSFLKPRKKALTRLVTANGKYLRNMPKPIDSKDTDGITATSWREAKVLNKIPMHLDVLLQAHACLSRLKVADTADMFAVAQGEDIAYLTDTIEKLLVMARTDVAGRGYLMHRYIESQSGRLYAKGFSLQTAPRVIRKAALHGLYEYDFENCHYAIFSQMASRHGYDCQAIRHYMANKRLVRVGIANRVGISEQEAKQCLLAIMYGARTTEWHENAIPRLLGRCMATRLYQDAQFDAIAQDIRQGRQAIIQGHPRRRTTLVNAMNKRIRLDQGSDKILAHLMQGIEAKALRVAIDLYPIDVVLLMHDGFITTRPVDMVSLEAAVREITGYDLVLTGEQISIPPDLEFSKTCNGNKPNDSEAYSPVLTPALQVNTCPLSCSLPVFPPCVENDSSWSVQ